MHRIGFTTSRFDSVDDLAGYIGPAAVQHAVLATAAPLQSPTTLPERPSGDQLDSAFQLVQSLIAGWDLNCDVDSRGCAA